MYSMNFVDPSKIREPQNKKTVFIQNTPIKIGGVSEKTYIFAPSTHKNRYHHV